MSSILKSAWSKWMKFANFLGNVVSATVLTIFYFSVFALFAIPFRLIKKPFGISGAVSNWRDRKSEFSDEEAFKQEF